ncbi:MAG: hypothetical protein UZ10_BCD003001955 [Bacteroidetes bacterium OLB10]|nr:MAG: hypothetical protein UZ10_BCD003001955 [Bacteroidetes bacterium OLB10]
MMKNTFHEQCHEKGLKQNKISVINSNTHQAAHRVAER